MLEIAIASVLIAVAFVAVGTTSRPMLSSNVTELVPATGMDGLEEQVVDLPCPWCHAQTREDDSSCPSCGQPFG